MGNTKPKKRPTKMRVPKEEELVSVKNRTRIESEKFVVVVESDGRFFFRNNWS